MSDALLSYLPPTMFGLAFLVGIVWQEYRDRISTRRYQVLVDRIEKVERDCALAPTAEHARQRLEVIERRVDYDGRRLQSLEDEQRTLADIAERVAKEARDAREQMTRRSRDWYGLEQRLRRVEEKLDIRPAGGLG